MRPSAVPVVVRARGGLTDFRVDALALDALGADFAWRSQTEEEHAPPRYEIDVTGGANRLHVVGDATQ